MSQDIIVHIKNARLERRDLSLRLNIPIEKQFLCLAVQGFKARRWCENSKKKKKKKKKKFVQLREKCQLVEVV